MRTIFLSMGERRADMQKVSYEKNAFEVLYCMLLFEEMFNQYERSLMFLIEGSRWQIKIHREISFIIFVDITRFR